MKEFIYRADARFLNEIWDLREEELILLCPVYNSPVIFAPDWPRARKFGVHPGSYCSVDPKHLTVLFEIEDEPES